MSTLFKNFQKLKSSGASSPTLKLSNSIKDRKISSPSVGKPKIIKSDLKSFNFGKLPKMAKLPTAKKVTALKKVVKRVKNVGF